MDNDKEYVVWHKFSIILSKIVSILCLFDCFFVGSILMYQMKQYMSDIYRDNPNTPNNAHDADNAYTTYQRS